MISMIRPLTEYQYLPLTELEVGTPPLELGEHRHAQGSIGRPIRPITTDRPII